MEREKHQDSPPALGKTHEKPSAPDWIIGNIAEASKNAQQVFFVLVSLLVYCAISVTGTADRQVVLNSTVQLPVLNSTVSLEGFFLLAPVFALLVFVYLQLYLQRLKGLIHQLRADYAQVESRRLAVRLFFTGRKRGASISFPPAPTVLRERFEPNPERDAHLRRL